MSTNVSQPKLLARRASYGLWVCNTVTSPTASSLQSVSICIRELILQDKTDLGHELTFTTPPKCLSHHRQTLSFRVLLALPHHLESGEVIRDGAPGYALVPDFTGGSRAMHRLDLCLVQGGCMAEAQAQSSRLKELLLVDSALRSLMLKLGN